VWFSKLFRFNHSKSNYVQIKVNGDSAHSTHAKNAVIKYRIKQ